MTWRSVMISKPAQLKREHSSLAVVQDQTAYVPFEDIAVIVLNHREITLTHPVLSACADFGISLFSTGDTHQPNGVFLPFISHSRVTKWFRLQLNLPRPHAKQAWAIIVRQKITNQSLCLALVDLPGADYLQRYVRRVHSGDPSNLEGVAAAYYFVQLFGIGFTRAQNNFINAALNYGYSIIRGAISRGLVAHGLLPVMGLFHSNEQNAFNLADDIIEPFRPIVDLTVANMDHSLEDGLLPQDKVVLIGILNVDVMMPRGKMSVLSAIEQTIESLARFYERGDGTMLELPNLIKLELHALN